MPAATRRFTISNGCAFPTPYAAGLRSNYRRLRSLGLSADDARRIIWASIWLGTIGEFVASPVRLAVPA